MILLQDIMKLRGKVTKVTLTTVAAEELLNEVKGVYRPAESIPAKSGLIGSMHGIDFSREDV